MLSVHSIFDTNLKIARVCVCVCVYSSLKRKPRTRGERILIIIKRKKVQRNVLLSMSVSDRVPTDEIT